MQMFEFMKSTTLCRPLHSWALAEQWFKASDLFTPWSWQLGPDLSSSSIPFSGCSNSSLTSAHLHNWIKTFARKLKCPLNCSLFHFNSSVDWFFFSFKLRHIRASVSHSEGQAAWVLHSKLYADMHRGAFRVHKAAESWGSETAEGPWCSRDETGELLSPWLWHHDQNTKLSLFTYAASKHPRCYSMRSGDLD